MAFLEDDHFEEEGFERFGPDPEFFAHRGSIVPSAQSCGKNCKTNWCGGIPASRN
jgi:hypothetical protein